MGTENNEQKACDNGCLPYNGKSAIVKDFIEFLKGQKAFMGSSSSRQKELFDLGIRHLELARRTITLKDVRQRLILIEDDMECPCGEEDDNKNYRNVFQTIYIRLHSDMLREMNNPVETIRVCWSENEHFCNLSKPYYEETVNAGLMNADYSWNKKTTKMQIAKWIDLFARRWNIDDQWIWAERVWGLKNMKQSLSKCNDLITEEKTKAVEQIFEQLNAIVEGDCTA